MPFLTGYIQVTAYNDSAQTEYPVVKICDIKRQVSDTALVNAQPTLLHLAASTSQAISLNGLSSVWGFYAYSSVANLTFTLNGNALTLKSGVPGFIPLAVTSLTVTNLSSTLATDVEIVLFND